MYVSFGFLPFLPLRVVLCWQIFLQGMGFLSPSSSFSQGSALSVLFCPPAHCPVSLASVELSATVFPLTVTVGSSTFDFRRDREGVCHLLAHSEGMSDMRKSSVPIPATQVNAQGPDEIKSTPPDSPTAGSQNRSEGSEPPPKRSYALVPLSGQEGAPRVADKANFSLVKFAHSAYSTPRESPCSSPGGRGPAPPA